MTQTSPILPPRLSALRWPALGVGLLALLACAAGGFFDRPHFFRAYLWAYLFWLGIALGSLSIAMVHNLTGGRWGLLTRRVNESASLTLPLLAVLFLPLLLGLPELYPWARPADVAREHTLQHRAGFFPPWMFILRAAIYFAIWHALAFSLSRWSLQADYHPTRLVLHRLQKWSALGLVIYLLTMTHASIDWALSRDIEFYSTTYGLIVTLGQTLSGVAFALLILAALLQRPPLAELRDNHVLIDLGNILLTLVILWAYVSFFQLLVIWMGNTREDNTWYTQRGMGNPPSIWHWVGLFLIVVHFAVPFFVLLFRGAKRNLAALTTLAAIVLAAHLVEQIWLVVPSGATRGPRFDMSWMDLLAPIGIGGVWLSAFLGLLTCRPLVARPTPEEEESAVPA